jgi:hypothetical protein
MEKKGLYPVEVDGRFAQKVKVFVEVVDGTDVIVTY